MIAIRDVRLNCTIGRAPSVRCAAQWVQDAIWERNKGSDVSDIERHRSGQC